MITFLEMLQEARSRCQIVGLQLTQVSIEQYALSQLGYARLYTLDGLSFTGILILLVQ